MKMNARTLLNGTLSTLLSGWFVAATLPALNNEVLDPFQAFIATPVLLMLAVVVGVGAYRGLGRLQERLSQALASRARCAREADSLVDLGVCLLHGPR
jgi:hypothetical protein